VSDQVFEVLGEISFWLVALVDTPEGFVLLLVETPIMSVLFLCLSKWRVSSVQDEDDNSHGEQVNACAAIWLALTDFWGLVAWSTKWGGQETGAFATFSWGGKAKVSNFKIELVIQHYVFRFKITMSDTLIVEIVQHV